MIITRVLDAPLPCRAKGCRALAAYRIEDGNLIGYCCWKPAHLAELLRALKHAPAIQR